MRKLFLFAIISFFSFSYAQNIKILSTSGKVEIQEDGTWVKVKPEQELQKNSIISTGFKSSAVIQIEDSQFEIGALTRVKIEDLISANKKDNSELFINPEEIAENSDDDEKKRSGFKVRSPVATSAIRGAKFSLSPSGELNVNQGVVSVESIEKIKILNKSENTEKPEKENSNVDAK